MYAPNIIIILPLHYNLHSTAMQPRSVIIQSTWNASRKGTEWNGSDAMTFRNLYTAKLFHELFHERQRHYYSLCKNSNDLLFVRSKSISETLSALLALLNMLKFKYIMKWNEFLNRSFFQVIILIVFKKVFNSFSMLQFLCSVMLCAVPCRMMWWWVMVSTETRSFQIPDMQIC